MDELLSWSAVDLASSIRSGSISPVEVAQAHLECIAQFNHTLNAIVTPAPDILERAQEAEGAIRRGAQLGPLHGVPLTIKDTIETAGLRTTSGSAMRAEFVPQSDAPVVARLKAAGAIILGKTNTAEMAMDYTADNPVFGRTNNPCDLSLSPGGSSGGEAAAIAAHMSPGGIGSDLAGSIRIPAHFCGIAGLKPTVGRVPGAGQFPPSTGPYSLGAVIGPMARSVSDLWLLFSVLSGVAIEPDPCSAERRAALAGTRVAFYTADTVSPVTAETREAVEHAAQFLSEAGMIVDEVRPPGVERGHDLWLRLLARASVVQLRNVYAGNEEKGGDFVRWRMATADDSPALSLDEYIQSWLERDRLRAQLIDWMAETPIIVSPVGSTPAYKHGTLKVSIGDQTLSTFRAFSYAQTFNVFDLPVAVIRAGTTAAGLPIGVQIIGRPFTEQNILAVATIIEKAIGGSQPPPLLSDKF